MKIVINGTGAMGSLYATLLTQAGHKDLWCVDGWTEHVNCIQKNGLDVRHIDQGKEEWENVRFRIFHSCEEARESMGCNADVVLIFVKAVGTEQAIQEAACLIGPETKVVSVQNGVGNADVLAKYVKPENIYFGTTTLGAQLLAPGKINGTSKDVPNMHTLIMPYRGKVDDKIREVAATFNIGGINMQVSEDTEAKIWEKLCSNAAGNPLTGLLRLTAGTIASDEDGEWIMTQVIEETVKVAAAKGLKLNVDWVLPFSKKIPSMASMGVDFKFQRQTEIEVINGAIVRGGKEFGIPTPVNEVLYHMVRAAQRHYSERCF